MTPLLLAALAGYGVFLLYTAVALGWRGVGFGPAIAGTTANRRRRPALPPREVLLATAATALVGLATGLALFGGALPALPALATAAFAATFPAAAARTRRERRRSDARDAWPRLIEEMRLQTGALGRSIPQALFEIGRRAPQEMQAAFAVAEREWLLSTDLTRTVAILKRELGDPTADATLETLLVAHHVGGSDVDRRLAALVEDRVQDLEGRKDARAKQAGVRFARRFVLVVPFGMALAGLSIGTGRAAYQTPSGQLAVAAGLAVVAACWAWAGRLLRLPEEERVFDA